MTGIRTLSEIGHVTLTIEIILHCDELAVDSARRITGAPHIVEASAIASLFCGDYEVHL
jgi:hypothetical protein